MAKRQKMLMWDRLRYKVSLSKVLAAASWCSTKTARREHHAGRLDHFYVISALVLKHMEKGIAELPWYDFYHLPGELTAGAFTEAAGVVTCALSLGFLPFPRTSNNLPKIIHPIRKRRWDVAKALVRGVI
jgi:hypothetical protein